MRFSQIKTNPNNSSSTRRPRDVAVDFLEAVFNAHLAVRGVKSRTPATPLGTAGVTHYTTLSRYAQPLDILYDVLVI